MIYKVLGALSIGVAIFAGGMFKGRHDVTVVLERERAVHKAEYDKQAAETARIKGERDRLSQEVENELRPKLQAADVRGADLADRLRVATRRSIRSLSCPQQTAVDPSGAAGDDQDTGGTESPLDAALKAHLKACDRVEERYLGWQGYYQGQEAVQ